MVKTKKSVPIIAKSALNFGGNNSEKMTLKAEAEENFPLKDLRIKSAF